MKTTLLFLLLALGSQVAAASTNYYVNDSNTVGDVYCGAIGNDANSGLDTNHPKYNVSSVLTNILHGGDVIYMDTGVYSNYTFSATTNHNGSAGNYIVLQGSTNGTILINPGSYVIDLGNYLQGQYWNIRDITLRNSTYGVQYSSAHSFLLERVCFLSNTYGIYAPGGGNHQNMLDHCILKGNTIGIEPTDDVYGFTFNCCIFWDNGTAISRGINHESPPSITMSNSVFRGGTVLGYMSSVSGDYNVFWQTTIKSGTYPNLNALQQARSNFWHSVVVDPQVADSTNLDFHLKSTDGRFVAGAGWTNDTESSPLIDLGNPAAPKTNEPLNSQGVNAAVDIGCYGNTTEASKTPTNKALLCLTFSDGGQLGGAFSNTYWASWNMTGDTVTIAYSWDSGAHWANVATNIPATNGVYGWNLAGLSNSVLTRWRVVSEADASIVSTNAAPFKLGNGPFAFYVNDTNTINDVYCTAAGSDANDGGTPATPKYNVSAILAAYDLEPGDTVYIDTGTYTGYTFTVTASDQGSSGAYVVFQGSTNVAGGGSELNAAAGGYGVYVSGSYFTFRDLTLRGGTYGAYDGSVNQYSLWERVVFRNSTYGVYGIMGGTHRLRCLRCVFYGTTYGMANSTDSYGYSADQCVFWSNAYHFAGGWTASASYSASNCVFRGGQLIYGPTTVNGDYNVFWSCAYYPGTYDNLRQLQAGRNDFMHSGYVDPLFADGANLDFHPQSAVGRYVTGDSWTNDAATSPLIDFGSPASTAYTNEPAPNGGRLNAGRYGGTAEASKSRTNGWILALAMNDGGQLSGTSRVYWAWGVVSNHTVRIDYSANDGQVWTNVAGGIAITNSEYNWDTTLFPSSAIGRWRIASESNPHINSTNLAFFKLGSGPFSFYVNDSNTAGDVYCAGIGDDANNGALTNKPKYNVSAILGAYDLDAGDTVYIDTGVYSNYSFTVNPEDGGSASAYVTFQGSTNAVAGGTDLRGTSGTRIALYGAYGRFRDLTVSGGYGFSFTGNLYARLEQIVARNCTYGYYGAGGQYVDFVRCVAANNTYGLRSDNAGLNWNSGISWSNGVAFTDMGANTLTVTNSIMVGATTYAGTMNPGRCNYNLYWATTVKAGYPTFNDWKNTSGNDTNSQYADPLVANAAAYDFHLKSYEGRCSNGVWVLDNVMSPAIDAGPTNADWSLEPRPNGRRVNCGNYANTPEASMSRFRGSILLVR